ncbi:archaemetzincin-1 isoform X1 [Felis catus]|nr:archaemetzincin-1 isoform X1 [Felis catus]XP_023102080.2 archaemetzincin-1 isoform X1 [Felis catus]XP_044903288.1 archaemetzincin-1 isoform X1 [Felis catus]XP_044903289.1 archaemetzincin-1 isoform X1 [Felis catus]
MLQCRPAQEFSFGPRALKEALVSSDPTLRRLYASAFTPAERLFLAEAYNPQRTLFCTLLIHTAFDWLLSRPEAPEDFQTFHASLPPRRQSPARKHIYLQPIDLSEGPAGGALLEYLRDCTEAFFLGLQVRCLPSVAAASIHCSSRPSQDSDRLQLHTDGILSFLKSSKPGDALCVLGLTLSDLYPCEAWSFTFGKFLPGHGHLPRALSPAGPGELPLAGLHHAGGAQPGGGPAAAPGPLSHMSAEAAARPGLQAHRQVQETLRLDSSRVAARRGCRGAVRLGGDSALQRRLGPELRQRVGAPDPRHVEPHLLRGPRAGARGGAGLPGRPGQPGWVRPRRGRHQGARTVAGALHPGPGAGGDGGGAGAGGWRRGGPGGVGDVHGAAPGPQAGPALRPRRLGAAPGPGRHVLLPEEEAERAQAVQGGLVPRPLAGGGELDGGPPPGAGARRGTSRGAPRPAPSPRPLRRVLGPSLDGGFLGLGPNPCAHLHPQSGAFSHSRLSCPQAFTLCPRHHLCLLSPLVF